MPSLPSLLRMLRTEWLLFTAIAGLVVTSLHLGRLPGMTWREAQVLGLLWALFVSVRGLELSGLLAALAERAESSGRWLAAVMVALTFVLAAVTTNDAALAVMAPLTMTLRTPGRARLVILEALAANAGSALTPFGNPQNLFIFWKYGPEVREFIGAIWPFSLFSLALLLLAACLLPVRQPPLPPPDAEGKRISSSALMHGAMLLVTILVILRLLPLAALLIPAGHALALARRSLRIDYGLLATFAAFFMLSDNLQAMLGGVLRGEGHVFALSALASQVMSNVPAALLFSRFTEDWQALLWGVNVGGYGTVIASFANLIAWRAFMKAERDGRTRRLFSVRFLMAGMLMFLATSALHWLLLRWR